MLMYCFGVSGKLYAKRWTPHYILRYILGCNVVRCILLKGSPLNVSFSYFQVKVSGNGSGNLYKPKVK